VKYFSIILAILGLVYSIYRFRKDKQKAIDGLGKIDKGRPPKLRIVYSRNQQTKDRKKIQSSQDAYAVFKKIWSKQIEVREEMYVLFLNRKNNVLGYHILSIGGITGTVADLRLLFAVALKSLATSIIIAHNHPSGQLSPSGEDIELTKKIKETGDIMNITLLDHLIVTTDTYYSFSDEGDL